MKGNCMQQPHNPHKSSLSIVSDLTLQVLGASPATYCHSKGSLLYKHVLLLQIDVSYPSQYHHILKGNISSILFFNKNYFSLKVPCSCIMHIVHIHQYFPSVSYFIAFPASCPLLFVYYYYYLFLLLTFWIQFVLLIHTQMCGQPMGHLQCLFTHCEMTLIQERCLWQPHQADVASPLQGSLFTPHLASWAAT